MSKRPLKLTDEQILAGRSRKGGWTRATLARWGVPWPPPKGWRKALIAGAPIPEHQPKEQRLGKPNWSGTCENCGASPIVPLTGMCGPCTFGEAGTVGGNW